MPVAEPSLDADKDEVKEAYEKAASECRRLESAVASCPAANLQHTLAELQVVQGATQRLMTRYMLMTSLGEHERKFHEHRVAIDTEVGSIRSVAEGAGRKAEQAVTAAAEQQDAVEFLLAGYHDLRRIVDRIDNKQRSQNLIVFGLTRGDALSAAETLLQDRKQLWRNLDDAFFLGKSTGRCPLLLHFASTAACNDCVAYSHSSDFYQRFQGVTMVRDRSDLRRTGVSRLTAADSALRDAYPGIKIHQHRDFIEFEGRRVDAIDFAASAVTIGVSLFDVDKACEANGRYEVNQGVFTRVGDTIVFGYRRKDGVPASPKRREDGHPVPDDRAGVGQRSQQNKRRNEGTLAGADFITAGGARFFDGQGRHRGANQGSVVMGASTDTYDVR
jgi:hypothetical protein